MKPRTTALVVFGILVGSLFLRMAIFRFGLLPVTAEVVLKKAKAIQVGYVANGQSKSLRIDNRPELSELLSLLHLDETNSNFYGFGVSGLGPKVVSFEMPDGQHHSFSLNNRGSIGPFAASPMFCERLNNLVSQHEGLRVDIYGQDKR